MLKYAESIRQGVPLPSPVYLHPSLTHLEHRELVAIDGARRLMAFLEADRATMEVIVLVAPGAC